MNNLKLLHTTQLALFAILIVSMLTTLAQTFLIAGYLIASVEYFNNVVIFIISGLINICICYVLFNLDDKVHLLEMKAYRDNYNSKVSGRVGG